MPFVRLGGPFVGKSRTQKSDESQCNGATAPPPDGDHMTIAAQGSSAHLLGRQQPGIACWLLVMLLLTLVGCGGGRDTSPSSTPALATTAPSTARNIGASGNATPVTPSIASTSANAVDIVIDGGTAHNQGATVPNVPYVTVTICQPGSTTACQTLDHVLLDTGSVGLRIFADALDGTATPPTMIVDSTHQDVRECVNFVGGYSWGSMGMVDMTLGRAKVARFPIMIIGDPRAGTAPAACAQGPSLNSGLERGMKGILGVGHNQVDCGPLCESARSSRYYACRPGTSDCERVGIPVAQQISNPVRAIGENVNGVVLQFPPVPSRSAAQLHGTAYFGIGTHPDNTPSSSTQIYKLDASGLFTTTIGGRAVTNSAVDSGSNAIWYPGSLPTCSQHATFFCPDADVNETALITSTNNVGAKVTFPVENADTALKSRQTLIPGLAGQASSPVDQSDWFLWGMPFHFGRSVFIVFEGRQYQGTPGPAIIF